MCAPTPVSLQPATSGTLKPRATAKSARRETDRDRNLILTEILLAEDSQRDTQIEPGDEHPALAAEAGPARIVGLQALCTGQWIAPRDCVVGNFVEDAVRREDCPVRARRRRQLGLAPRQEMMRLQL